MNCVGLFAERLDVPIIGIAPVAFSDPLLSGVSLTFTIPIYFYRVLYVYIK